MVSGLASYLGLAAILFGIGAVGFVTRRNLLLQLMSIEIMLNATNLAFVAANRAYPEDLGGQVFAFFVIAVAAAEAAVGLAILIALYRLIKTVDSDKADQLRG
ncbi:MAG: NADH-quinone oxidoreductase subunit NuoK [Sandaracinaceae bacterium]|nr:NADH-quinone oxidoreductase subunit NuoK [Sandaracinaceae bacterium]MDW8247128.1 NADH-quinone oxidoreductase subunit NuoK [Sandaracinaceae bacterium]